jgi:hypothetical protein
VCVCVCVCVVCRLGGLLGGNHGDYCHDGTHPFLLTLMQLNSKYRGLQACFLDYPTVTFD